VDPKTQPIIGFQTVAATVGVEREFILRPTRKTRGRLTIAPSYNWQANFPFAYQGTLPAGLARSTEPNGDKVGGPVLVAFPALLTTLDFRDDPITTHAGIYLTNSLQVADKVFGGSVSDVRVQPEIRGFVPITKKTVTLATRLTMGFLIPRDYGSTLKNGTPKSGPTDPLLGGLQLQSRLPVARHWLARPRRLSDPAAGRRLHESALRHEPDLSPPPWRLHALGSLHGAALPLCRPRQPGHLRGRERRRE
jgi:hypothetical protein